MPPRRSTRSSGARSSGPPAAAAGPAPAMAPGFASLPENLAIHMLGLLPLNERHRACPLVSRTWHSLVHSPELLRSIEVILQGDFPLSLVPLAESFFSWLPERAAEHVEVLHIHILDDVKYSINWDTRDEEELDLVEALLDGLEAVAQAGASRLRELRISLALFDLALSPRWERWSAPLLARGLRCLEVSLLAQEEWYEETLLVEAPLHVATGLEELTLQAQHLEMAPDVRFPPSLTKLVLAHEPHAWPPGTETPVLPHLPQLLAPLSRLQQLGLRGTNLYGVDFAALVTLTRLALRQCGPLPAAASRLTGLSSLAWEAAPHHQWTPEQLAAVEGTAAALGPVLGCAAQLTFLALQDFHALPAALPGTLASLRHQEIFCCKVLAERLPGGTWLHRLRALAVPLSTAAASLAALEEAHSLECLCLLSATSFEHIAECEGYQSHALPAANHCPLLPTVLAVLRWVAQRQRPTLRWLSTPTLLAWEEGDAEGVQLGQACDGAERLVQDSNPQVCMERTVEALYLDWFAPQLMSRRWQEW